MRLRAWTDEAGRIFTKGACTLANLCVQGVRRGYGSPYAGARRASRAVMLSAPLGHRVYLPA